MDTKWDAIAQAAANFNALNKEPELAAGILISDKTGEDNQNNNVLDVWKSENYLNAWAKNTAGQNAQQQRK